MATKEWKPRRKVVIEPDPESVATRIRSRHVQDGHDQMTSHPHDLNIDSVCYNESGQECTKSPRSVQTNWKSCYKCALSPRENTSQLVKNH